MPELSIIIPVYQVEEYISDCLNSILAQTYKDYEVIMIDDGSVDNSGKICELFANKDNRFKVYHQDNHGVSAARNNGLAHASGTYISFVDPDDYLNPKMYEQMVSAARRSDADLAVCGLNIIEYPSGATRIKVIGGEKDVHWDREELCRHLFDMPQTIYFSCWNKLFLKDRIRHQFDTELTVGEDMKFLADYIQETGKAVYIPNALYYYRHREGSALMQSPEKKLQMLNVLFDTAKSMEKTAPEAAVLCRRRYFDKCVWLKNLENCNPETRKIIRRKLRSDAFYIAFHRNIRLKERILWFAHMVI